MKSTYKSVQHMYEVLTEQLTILSIQYDVAAVPIKHVIVPSIQYNVPAVPTEHVAVPSTQYKAKHKH